LKEYTLLRTDRDDWIELVTDGEKMWLEVKKQQGKQQLLQAVKERNEMTG